MLQILINVVGAHVRLALRIYFTVVLILISYLGDRCCALRVRRRLHHYEAVDLSQMTGWLSGGRLATAVLSLRGLPVGWLGAIMILVGLLSFGCDLAVSGLVVAVEVPDRCPFNITGPYATLYSEPFNDTFGVWNAGPLYDMVTGAQTASLMNDGLDGIYGKYNMDWNFRADPVDVVGHWTCNTTGQTKNYSATAEVGDIGTNLYNESFIYGNYWEQWTGDGYYTHGLLVWSAGPGPEAGDPWSIRAAVQIPADITEPKEMVIYSCNLHAPALEWLLPLFLRDVGSFLQPWAIIVQSNLYPGYINIVNPSAFPSDPGEVIASKLNSAIMIVGASSQQKDHLNSTENLSQGCVTVRTVIPWPVASLFVLTILLTLGLSVYLIALLLLIRHTRSSNGPAYVKAVESDTPDGPLSWMRLATKGTGKWRPSWATQWRFGPSNGAPGTLALACSPRSDEESEPLTLLQQTPPTPKSSYPYNENTGYSSHNRTSSTLSAPYSEDIYYTYGPPAPSASYHDHTAFATHSYSPLPPRSPYNQNTTFNSSSYIPSWPLRSGFGPS